MNRNRQTADVQGRNNLKSLMRDKVLTDTQFKTSIEEMLKKLFNEIVGDAK